MNTSWSYEWAYVMLQKEDLTDEKKIRGVSKFM